MEKKKSKWRVAFAAIPTGFALIVGVIQFTTGFNSIPEILDAFKETQTTETIETNNNELKDNKEITSKAEQKNTKANENNGYNTYSFDNITVGDIITFGSYYQQENAKWDEKKDDIEWIVLNVENNEALLVSKYALGEDTPFSDNWEESAVRNEWIHDFYKNAFNGEEKSRIVTTIRSDFYGNDNEYSTEDKVFLLSESEVADYLQDTQYMDAFPTEYARTGSQSIDKPCRWMLATGSRDYPGEILCVLPNGRIMEFSVYDDHYIRPACIIKIN